MRQRGQNSANKAERNQPQQLNEGIEMNPRSQSKEAQKRESPLGGNQGALYARIHNPIVAESSDNKALAALITGVHVVVVEASEGKYRRRVYFSLASAQRALDRATMAGHSARLILCRLMPANGGEDL